MTLQDACLAAAADLRAAGPRLVQTEAQTLLALATLRVQNDGLSGRHYSSNPVPVFFFTNKALNAGGRDYIKQQQKVKGKQKGLGTWAGLRAAEGLPTDNVNLTHSGRMFRSLATIYSGFSGNIYTASIVSSDRESAKVVQYNIERYGNFLAPTPSETAEATTVTNQEVTSILGAYFKVN
ncbi:MAG: hypothetical protein ACRYG7_07645 [Janthinobacterium lividum]